MPLCGSSAISDLKNKMKNGVCKNLFLHFEINISYTLLGYLSANIIVSSAGVDDAIIAVVVLELETKEIQNITHYKKT